MSSESKILIDIAEFFYRIKAMNFHVARDGEIIGEFDEQVFRDKVFRGEVRRDDFYWTEGMTEWQSVVQYRAGARTQVIRREPPAGKTDS